MTQINSGRIKSGMIRHHVIQMSQKDKTHGSWGISDGQGVHVSQSETSGTR